MSIKTELLNYNGKTFYFMDFSNMKTVEELQEVIQPSIQYIRNQPESSVLTLSNIGGMHFNSEIKEVFMKFISGNKPFVKAGAVAGVSGLQRIVYNGLMKLTGRDLRSFDNLDQAKEWLVKM